MDNGDGDDLPDDGYPAQLDELSHVLHAGQLVEDMGVDLWARLAFHCLRIPRGIAMAVMSASVYQVMA
jgi:hypothetical protein